MNRPGTEESVVVRRPARSAVYRAALRPRARGCAGVLLGTHLPGVHLPEVDDALVTETALNSRAFEDVPARLLAALDVSAETSAGTGQEPVGLFVAWDDVWITWDHGHSGFDGPHHQLFGALVDAARAARLPLVARFPTWSGEVLSRPCVHATRRFPDAPLRVRSLPRRSDRPEHNPRRLRRAWRRRLTGLDPAHLFPVRGE